MTTPVRTLPASERGFALLIVLWALVPLALMFTALAATARSEAQSTASLREAAALEAAADGAIYTAIFTLLEHTGPGVAKRPVRTAMGNVTVMLSGLSGLVNPNTASAELMQALLRRLGTDSATAGFIASAIVDWRTPGQKARPGGAKAAEYRSAGRDYGPPGSPFESLDELGQVLGTTPRLLQALTPYLSLHAYGMPDPGSADPIVRAALSDIGLRGAGVQRTAAARTEVVQITAVATGAGEGQSTRRAIVKVERSPAMKQWRVLSWDSLPAH